MEIGLTLDGDWCCNITSCVNPEVVSFHQHNALASPPNAVGHEPNLFVDVESTFDNYKKGKAVIPETSMDLISILYAVAATEF